MEKFDFEDEKIIQTGGPLDYPGRPPWMSAEEIAREKMADRRMAVEMQILEDVKKRLAPYDAQLEHIHKALVGQAGPENILKLAQAEEIVYNLRERVKEAKNEPVSEIKPRDKV